MNPKEFINALFDLSFTASMNQHWLREELARAVRKDNAVTFAVGVITVLSIITVITAISPKSKADNAVRWTTIPTAFLATIAFLYTVVYRPSAEIERYSVLRQRWIDLRGDIDDLYIVERDKEHNAKSAEDLKFVSQDLVTALRVIEQRKKRLNDDQKELKPDPKRWHEIEEEETQRRWGKDIRTPEDLEKKQDDLKRQGKPPLELRVL